MIMMSVAVFQVHLIIESFCQHPIFCSVCNAHGNNSTLKDINSSCARSERSADSIKLTIQKALKGSSSLPPSHHGSLQSTPFRSYQTYSIKCHTSSNHLENSPQMAPWVMFPASTLSGQQVRDHGQIL